MSARPARRCAAPACSTTVTAKPRRSSDRGGEAGDRGADDDRAGTVFTARGRKKRMVHARVPISSDRNPDSNCRAPAAAFPRWWSRASRRTPVPSRRPPSRARTPAIRGGCRCCGCAALWPFAIAGAARPVPVVGARAARRLFPVVLDGDRADGEVVGIEVRTQEPGRDHDDLRPRVVSSVETAVGCGGCSTLVRFRFKEEYTQEQKLKAGQGACCVKGYVTLRSWPSARRWSASSPISASASTRRSDNDGQRSTRTVC